MQAAQAKAQQEAELKQAASQQLASREAELISQHTRALHDAMARAADELHAAQEASAAELEAARSEIRRLISLLEAGSDEASALREALARAAEETAAVRKAAEQAQAALQHEMLAQQERAALELGRERQQAKETLDQLLAEQLNETRAMTAEFQKAQALLQEQVGQLREQLRGLQARLDAREPRAEDLATIEQLLRQLREKDEIVRRTYEEMKYFKLELQNREENFNKNFGGGPRVGVMMPTASKGSGAADKLRSGVAQAAAMNMGAHVRWRARRRARRRPRRRRARRRARRRRPGRRRLVSRRLGVPEAPVAGRRRGQRGPVAADAPTPPPPETISADSIDILPRPPDTPSARQGWEENKTQGPGGPKRESRERRPIASAGSQLGL